MNSLGSPAYCSLGAWAGLPDQDGVTMQTVTTGLVARLHGRSLDVHTSVMQSAFSSSDTRKDMDLPRTDEAHLDDAAASLLKVIHLLAQRQRQLVRLRATAEVLAGE